MLGRLKGICDAAAAVVVVVVVVVDGVGGSQRKSEANKECRCERMWILEMRAGVKVSLY